jgi:hypothetical protein
MPNAMTSPVAIENPQSLLIWDQYLKGLQVEGSSLALCLPPGEHSMGTALKTESGLHQTLNLLVPQSWTSSVQSGKK